jgi:hypothetical protein
MDTVSPSDASTSFEASASQETVDPFMLALMRAHEAQTQARRWLQHRQRQQALARMACAKPARSISPSAANVSTDPQLNSACSGRAHLSPTQQRW